MTKLSELTTMQVGGTPARLVEATTHDELLTLAREAFVAEEPWFVLGGGSNLVASDEGFPGTVIHVATRGVDVLDAAEGEVRLRVAAGEPWDELVALTVSRGWSGIEALSGIPGSVGAAPVQNIGAYGQEVSETVVSVDFLDADTAEFLRIPRANLGLDYRTSVFKPGLTDPARLGVITAVEFLLADGGECRPRWPSGSSPPPSTCRSAPGWRSPTCAPACSTCARRKEWSSILPIATPPRAARSSPIRSCLAKPSKESRPTHRGGRPRRNRRIAWSRWARNPRLRPPSPPGR
ncbi:hypothetical protein GCM10025867_39580 [Frondihabitans sucicola]|uniref:UDP-N-acetylenolpyruvoylglucosamine reductase n=1 Tax=Frondihabitans sucicola TaxID=1268041 RepID=A0ABM8GTC4_9MICO|nr:hypothetical protein GCM10025867_39580 [Frondihabitans sucicola]